MHINVYYTGILTVALKVR